MSVINQTLRDLDARKTDSKSAHTPAQRVSAPSRSKRVFWMAGAVLLPIVGLAIWFAMQPAPADPPVPVEAAQIAVSPHVTVEPAPAVVPEEVLSPQPASPAVKVSPAAAANVPLRLKDEAPIAPQLTKSLQQPLMEMPRAEGGAEQKSPGVPPGPGLAKTPIISKEVKKASPEEDAEDRYRKALTLMNKGRDNLARPLLEEALRLSPAHVPARQLLATQLNEMGLNREAEAVLLEGRAISPDVGWFALSLARLQAVRGDVEAAAATMQGGIEGPGVNAEYRATYAALLARLKKHSEAARQYELALKQQPDQGAWWMGLGLAKAAQGKTDEAHFAYGRALKAGNLSEKLEDFVRAKLAE